MKRITVEYLEGIEACPAAIANFRARFGEGVDVTADTVQEALRGGFAGNLCWLVCALEPDVRADDCVCMHGDDPAWIANRLTELLP